MVALRAGEAGTAMGQPLMGLLGLRVDLHAIHQPRLGEVQELAEGVMGEHGGSMVANRR